LTNEKEKEFRKIKKIQVRIMEMKMVNTIKFIKVTIATIILLVRCQIMRGRHQKRAMKKVNMITMKKDKKRVNGMKRMIVD